MRHPGLTLIVIGLLIAGIGLVWLISPSIPWLGKLPGDIRIERENFRFYFPLTTCILLSVVCAARPPSAVVPVNEMLATFNNSKRWNIPRPTVRLRLLSDYHNNYSPKERTQRLASVFVLKKCNRRTQIFSETDFVGL